MNRMRLRIAERLKESQNAAASLTTFNEIDMSSLMEMRKKYKDEVLKEHEVKLGFMSAFAKASCLALQQIPSANASIEVRLAILVLPLPLSSHRLFDCGVTRCGRRTTDWSTLTFYGRCSGGLGRRDRVSRVCRPQRGGRNPQRSRHARCQECRVHVFPRHREGDRCSRQEGQ